MMARMVVALVLLLLFIVVGTDAASGCTAPTMMATISAMSQISCWGLTDGSVTLAASGGVGPFDFNFDNRGWTTQASYTNLGVGIFWYFVRDSRGCVEQAAIQILDPETQNNKHQLFANVLGTSGVSCYGAADGTASLGASGGNNAGYEYNFNNNGFSTLSVYSAPAGTYSFTIRDAADGCTVSSTVTISGNGKNPLYANVLGTTPISCNGASDASVTLGGSGGNGASYSINFNGNGWNSQWTIGSLGAGNYNFQVRDDTDNCIVSNSVNVLNKNPVYATVQSTTPISCYGATDGAVTLRASGGNTAGYEYNFRGSGWVSTASFSSVPPGLYNFQVRDADNCVASSTVVVSNKNPLYATVSGANAISCYGSSDGYVALGASGGNSASYDVNFNGNGWNTQWNYGSLPSGTYSFQVRDAEGCVVSNTVTVPGKNPLYATVSGTNSISCYGSSDGSVSLSASGGNSASYDVNFNGNGWNTQWSYGSLPTGTYSFQVRDAEGCVASNSVSVGGKNPLYATVSGSNAISCYGSSDGSVSLGASGGNSASYQVNFNGNGWNTQWSYGSLPTGTYSFQVRDADSCTAANSVTVAGKNPLYATVSGANPISCYGNSDGSVSLGASGGNSASYIVNFNGNGWSSQWSYGTLPAGTYSFQVQDADSCVVSNTVTVASKNPLYATVSGSNAISCYGNSDGSVSLGANGGNSASYTVNFNGNGWNSQWSYGSLPSGTYSFQVRDADSCVASNTVSVSGKNPLYATVSGANPISCYGSTDGSVSLSASGGNSASYQVNFNGNGWNTQWGYGSLPPGTYSFQVRDADSCTASNTVSVGGKNLVVASVTGYTAQICSGTATGTAHISASGGTNSGYSINFNNEGWNTVWDYNALYAGTFPFSVRDSDNCVASSSVTIDAAAAFTVSSSSTPQTTCSGAPSGSITITASGGAKPHTYSIEGSNFQTSNIFTSLAAGNYHYKVLDANSCSAEGDEIVSSSASTLSSTVTPTPITCPADGNTGHLSIVATGGQTPYSYSIDGGSNYGSADQIPNLASGIYNVVVRDANLCTHTTSSVQVTRPPAFNVVATSHNQTCAGGNTAGISFTASGANGGFTYTLNGAPTAAVNNTLPAGTYNWVVTDSKSCTTSGSETIISIDVHDPPTLTIVSAVPTDGGVMTITGTNFFAPLSLTVNGASKTIDSFTQTRITCQIPAGTGLGHKIGLVSGTNPCLRIGNTTWSYAKPYVSGTSVLAAQGGPLTISGTNFGNVAATVSVSISAVYCSSCSFVAGQVICGVCPSGSGQASLLVTVDGLSSDSFTITYGSSATAPPTSPPTDPPTDPPTAPPTSQPTGSPTAPPTGSPTNPPTSAPTSPPTPRPVNGTNATCGNNICERLKENCTTCESDCGLCVLNAPVFDSLYNFANSSNTIVVHWNTYPIANTSYFYVLQMSQEQTGSYSTIYAGNNTQFVVQNLTMATEYFFKLAAARGIPENLGAAVLGSFSSASKSTSGYPGKPLLSLARYGRDYLTVAWKGYDGGCAMVNWTIQFSNSTNGTWHSLTALPSDPASHKYSNLTMSKKYYFRAQSTNVVGQSNISQITFMTDSPFCGDFVCDTNLGENCSSCFFDCGACSEAVCPGTPTCSDQGKCVEGKCVCAGSWAGPDCSVSGTVPIEVGVGSGNGGNGGNGGNSSTNGNGGNGGNGGNNVLNSTTVVFNPLLQPPEPTHVSFNLAMKTIQEIDTSNNIKTSFLLSDYKATVTKSLVYFNLTTTLNSTTANTTTMNTTTNNTTTSNSTLNNTTMPSNTTKPGNVTQTNTTNSNNTTKPVQPSNTIAVTQIVYNITLPNMATVTISLLVFPTAFQYRFGDKIISVPANSIKYSILVKNWKFASIRNRLQMVMLSESKSSEDETPCTTSASSNDGSNHLQWFVLNIDGVSLYAQFVDSAILDGRQGKVAFDLSPSNEIIFTVPAFWESAEIDPTYSVLVDPSSSDCASDSSNNVSSKLIGIVCGSVGGVVAAMAGGMYSYKVRRQKAWMKRVSSHPSTDGVGAAL